MSIEEQILISVESIDGKVDKLLIWQATVEERCLSHRQQTNGLRLSIYGDDKSNIGLKAKVQSLLNCKKTITKQKEFWLSVLGKIVAYGIVGFFTWLLFIYKKV